MHILVHSITQFQSYTPCSVSLSPISLPLSLSLSLLLLYGQPLSQSPDRDAADQSQPLAQQFRLFTRQPWFRPPNCPDISFLFSDPLKSSFFNSVHSIIGLFRWLGSYAVVWDQKDIGKEIYTSCTCLVGMWEYKLFSYDLSCLLTSLSKDYRRLIGRKKRCYVNGITSWW